MKKLILTAILAAGQLRGAGLSIDLGALIHGVRHDRMTNWRRATGAIAIATDIVDWRTTYIGVVNGGDCEQNRFFNPSGACGVLNKPRFNFVKGLVIGLVAAEELTPKLPHSAAWNTAFIAGNVGLGITLGTVDIHNINVLTTK